MGLKKKPRLCARLSIRNEIERVNRKQAIEESSHVLSEILLHRVCGLDFFVCLFVFCCGFFFFKKTCRRLDQIYCLNRRKMPALFVLLRTSAEETSSVGFQLRLRYTENIHYYFNFP